jgi:hypothetical protein
MSDGGGGGGGGVERWGYSFNVLGPWTREEEMDDGVVVLV